MIRFQFSLARLLAAMVFFAAAAVAAMPASLSSLVIVPCVILGCVILITGLRRPSETIVEGTRSKPQRGSLQVSVRTLLCFIALVAVLLAYQLHWLQERRAFLQIDGVEDWTGRYSMVPAERPTAPAMLWLYGEEGVRDLLVPKQSDADISRARKLFPEANVAEIMIMAF